MSTGPPHHLVVAGLLFFFFAVFCFHRRRVFLTVLAVLPLVMELVQPLIPLNFSLEAADIFWNYLGAGIGIGLYALSRSLGLLAALPGGSARH